MTRFQPREHGGSSFKFLYGHEYIGEIAEFGESLWYRIAARVSSGRGKYEARFAKGIWVGKSEADDSHLVIDLERGVQKCRTVRRMPLEFRWNPELVARIAVTPWNTTVKTTSNPVPRSLYITEKRIDVHGPTDACPKCSTDKGSHPQTCRQRFEQIQADLLTEKLEQEAAGGQPPQAAPAPASSAPAAVAKASEIGGAASSSGAAVRPAAEAPAVEGDPPMKKSKASDIEMAVQTPVGESWDDFAGGLMSRASTRAGDPWSSRRRVP